MPLAFIEVNGDVLEVFFDGADVQGVFSVAIVVNGDMVGAVISAFPFDSPTSGAVVPPRCSIKSTMSIPSSSETNMGGVTMTTKYAVQGHGHVWVNQVAIFVIVLLRGHVGCPRFVSAS